MHSPFIETYVVLVKCRQIDTIERAVFLCLSVSHNASAIIHMKK